MLYSSIKDFVVPIKSSVINTTTLLLNSRNKSYIKDFHTQLV